MNICLATEVNRPEQDADIEQIMTLFYVFFHRFILLVQHRMTQISPNSDLEPLIYSVLIEMFKLIVYYFLTLRNTFCSKQCKGNSEKW